MGQVKRPRRTKVKVCRRDTLEDMLNHLLDLHQTTVKLLKDEIEKLEAEVKKKHG